MSFSLSRALRALQDPALRDGTELRGLLLALRTLVRQCCARRWSVQDAREDLVQECFVRLLTTPAVFRGATDAAARLYLCRMVRHLAIDQSRARTRRASTESLATEDLAQVEASSREPMYLLAIELASALEKTDAELQRMRFERSLTALLDELGMLPWSARARMNDAELAACLCTTPNGLQARRTRLRDVVEETTERLQRACRMSERERDAMLAIVGRSTERASSPHDRRPRRN